MLANQCSSFDHNKRRRMAPGQDAEHTFITSMNSHGERLNSLSALLIFTVDKGLQHTQKALQKAWYARNCADSSKR